jgi:hypothetical protein
MQETSSKGECFNLVTAMFTLADDHGRPQGHPSKAFDDQGKAAYGKCAVDRIFIFFDWM